jgi:signal transduction histidine kinase
LTDTDGAVTGIAAVVRDETERWAAEQELRRRLVEAEAATTPSGGDSG